MNKLVSIISGVAAFALAGAAWAHDPPAAAPSAATTANMQGDQNSWAHDPHMRQFYEAAVSAFAGGPAKVDKAAFETRSFEIFRAFAKSRGMNPEAMVDHLKLIPGQVVQIATEDPQALASYDNFVAAVFGPQ